MGHGASSERPDVTPGQLSHALTQQFAHKCFTPLELYCFKTNFKSLAKVESGILYWDEKSLCDFLELPDALGVGPIIFHMATSVGAFPFPSQAPATLTADALLRVVTILTGKYGPVLKTGRKDAWIRELYRSMAVFDRAAQQSIDQERKSNEESNETPEAAASAASAVEEEIKDSETFVTSDQDLILAALEALGVPSTFEHDEHSNIHSLILPTDNLLKIIELLLLIAPIDPQQGVSAFTANLTDDRIEELRQVASTVLSSFGVMEDQHGVDFRTFKSVVSNVLPYMFESLKPLFEYLLFMPDFGRPESAKTDPDSAAEKTDDGPLIPPPPKAQENEPVLSETGDVLNLTILNQLSFFIPGTELFRRLRPLYSGNKHGFSMGAFEKQTFNWRAPSILLLSGTILPAIPGTARERTLSDLLPPKRLASSVPCFSSDEEDDNNDRSRKLIFGAYIPTQWKHTPKTAFSDSSTLLFQLSPTHDVFTASTLSTNYAYFTKSHGIGFGTSIPSHIASLSHSSHSFSQHVFRPAAVSLHLDDSLEFGVFTHLSEGGGSFHPSKLPFRTAHPHLSSRPQTSHSVLSAQSSSRPPTSHSSPSAHSSHPQPKDWQDRFEVDALEVWGCGGDEEAEAQRREWAFHEREAEARRRINLGSGDREADWELLRLAGLVDQNRSGGSI